MKIIPLNNYVYITEDTQKETASGIILTEEQSKGAIGIVYAIGENEWQIEVGDKIIFSRFTAEDADLKDIKDKEGNQIKLKCLPLDSIHALVKE